MGRRTPRSSSRDDHSSAQAGSSAGLVRNPATKEPFPAQAAFGVRVGRRALENGLLCRFDPNWLAFGPPLISTAEQIDEMVAILDRSLGEVLAEVPVG